MIPYGHQEITQDDVDAVIEVLRSDYLTQGPAVPRFEKALVEYTGARHAIAVNSATSALHIACLALGLGPGDWLWTTPLTFVASANCALYCGAQVGFVDIDPGTWNMCPQDLERRLIEAEPLGKLPKIVVPVHLCGQPCDMEAIGALARRFGFKVIEDASHAVGARYRSEPVGNCRHSDITVFSFHPVKIITSGEGGAALTQDAALAERMSLLRSHGITRDPARMSKQPDGPWYYEQIALGFNYRMTDIQASLGASQMHRVDEYVRQRHVLARRYDAQFDGLPLERQQKHPDAHSALHLYVVRLRLGMIRYNHTQVFERLRAAGIGVNLHYIPVHMQPYYARMGFSAGQFPHAECYYREAISIPLFPTLGEVRQDRVIEAMRDALT